MQRQIHVRCIPLLHFTFIILHFTFFAAIAASSLAL